MSVRLRCVIRAGGARGADAEGLFLLIRREKVGLEGGEFERGVRIGSRVVRCRSHDGGIEANDCRGSVVEAAQCS